jgi:hypothetical protein
MTGVYIGHMEEQAVHAAARSIWQVVVESSCGRKKGARVELYGARVLTGDEKHGSGARIVGIERAGFCLVSSSRPCQCLAGLRQPLNYRDACRDYCAGTTAKGVGAYKRRQWWHIFGLYFARLGLNRVSTVADARSFSS